MAIRSGAPFKGRSPELVKTRFLFPAEISENAQTAPVKRNRLAPQATLVRFRALQEIKSLLSFPNCFSDAENLAEDTYAQRAEAIVVPVVVEIHGGIIMKTQETQLLLIVYVYGKEICINLEFI